MKMMMSTGSTSIMGAVIPMAYSTRETALKFPQPPVKAK